MEGIQPETSKAIALAALVRQLAKAGRAQEALREIDRLPVGATQVHILMHLGAGQAEAGDRKAARASFERADRLIGQEQDEGQRMGQAVNLATVRAEAGDYKGAIQTAETYFPKYTLGYANIAFAHAKAGDFTGALEIAEMLKNRQPPGGRRWPQPPGGRPRSPQGPDWWQLQILEATAEHQVAARRSQGSPGMDRPARLPPRPCLRPAGCRRGNPAGDDATRQEMNVGRCW